MPFRDLEESIKKKLSLTDYNTEIPQKVKKSKPQKVKLTVYLTEETIKLLNQMCSQNILQNGKQDKSSLISEAVTLLYKEKNK